MNEGCRTEWLELTYRAAGGDTYRLVEVKYLPEEASSFASAYRIECHGRHLGSVISTSLMFGRKWWHAEQPDGSEGDVMHERRRDAVAELCGALRARPVPRDSIRFYQQRSCYRSGAATPIDQLLAGA